MGDEVVPLLTDPLYSICQRRRDSSELVDLQNSTLYPACWNRTFTVPRPITRYLYLFVYVPYLAMVVHFLFSFPRSLSRTVDVDAVLPLWGTENLTGYEPGSTLCRCSLVPPPRFHHQHASTPSLIALFHHPPFGLCDSRPWIGPSLNASAKRCY